MDDPDITKEEYIQLMADKAQNRGQMFNWETTTCGNVYCDDLDSFTDFETNFPSMMHRHHIKMFLPNPLKVMNPGLKDKHPRHTCAPWYIGSWKWENDLGIFPGHHLGISHCDGSYQFVHTQRWCKMAAILTEYLTWKA
ncbi:hypothetical protein Tco_0690347, partial [Tanacetum coccineum]